MPRRPPPAVRADPSVRRSPGRLSTLLIGACPGPPVCSAVHTILDVDGLDLIARSDNRLRGVAPERLLSLGGPPYPTDALHEAGCAAEDSCLPECCGLTLRVRLRGDTVVWSGLMYPGDDGWVVEEARFDLGQYLGEIARAHSRYTTGPPSGPASRVPTMMASPSTGPPIRHPEAPQP